MNDYVEINKINKVKKHMYFPGVLVQRIHLPMKKCNSWSLGQEDHLRRERKPTPVFLPENPMNRGAGYSRGVARVRHDFTTKNKKKYKVSANK